MKKLQISALFLLAFLFISTTTGMAQEWTLQNVIQTALRVNPQLHGLEAQVKAREAALHQAKAIPNPEVGGITGNRIQMLTLGQQVEYPAKRRVRVRRAEAELDAAKWQLNAAKHEIAAAVMTMLYQINAVDQKVGLFKKNLAVSEQLLSAAQEKSDQGFGSRLDVIKAQVEVARARRLLLNVQKARLGRRSDLKLTLGLAPVDTLNLSDVLQISLLSDPVKMDSLLRVARHHPRLLRQRSLVQASQLDMQTARLATRPDFNFDLAGGVEDHESKIELELRIPLAVWDRKAGLKSEAHFLNQNAQHDSAAVWLEISRQVIAAFYNYQNAQQTRHLFSPSLLEEAKTAADMAQQAFQTGPYRFLDLIDARRTFLETAQEFIEAQANLRLAEVKLLQATGTFFPGEK